MGINGWELLVLLLVAIVVVGPERLPQAAEQLARVVRELRRVASGARERVREELGPEVADIDLAKLDPRQYDPRRIVREALMEDLDLSPRRSANGTGAAGVTRPSDVLAQAQQNAAAAGAAGALAASGDGGPGPSPTTAVPFDDEAT